MSRRLTLRRLKHLLRSPRLIVVEIATIAVAGVVGGTLPQLGTASVAELARLHEHGVVVGFLVDLFELDRVFRSAWFLAITLLASASLSIVVVEQARRARVMWSQRPTEAQLRAAPLRAEFDRPRRLAGRVDRSVVSIRTSGRLGLFGSPIFHLGILLVVVAGVLRALFAVDAAVDLIEGETLPPSAEAWSGQWPGVVARPFQLTAPLRLEAVRATRYEAGSLRDLTVKVSIDGGERREAREIGINRELHAAGGRLYLGSEFGPTALLELREPTGASTREAILLGSRGGGTYEAAAGGPSGTRLFLRTDIDREGRRPVSLELRVVGFGADGRFPLLFAGLLRAGSEIRLPGGATLRLHGLPFWARLRGSRDPALAVAYAGFALALVGASLIFTIVKVDTGVIVIPSGDRERVLVALRPQRFAPLFEERLARLVREQGGAA